MQMDTETEISSLGELYETLSVRNYAPLWTMGGALTREPETQMVPCLWHYEEVRSLILEAGKLISAEEADRRVLAFRNPGTGEHEITRTTDMLWAAIQLVLPGEVAPPHRHTPAALRYIIEGRGAYTTVDGERCEMEVGDFIRTPNWSWHEHGHLGEGPMLWLDGLDLPMANTLRLIFTERRARNEEAGEPTAGAGTPLGSGARVLRVGELEPAWAGVARPQTLVWKLADAEAALDSLSEVEGSPYDDLILEYRDPATQGPVLRTLSAYLQKLRPGVRTLAHRHTASAVYHVVRGRGVSIVAGETLEWSAGDTFAVPTWAEHQHRNDGLEAALLFSFSDEPAVRALGLYRADPGEERP